MGALHRSNLPRGQRCACLLTAVGVVALLSTTVPVLTGDIPADKRSSTYEQMSADTKAMQDEDTANPGMLWVLDGEAAWRTRTGAAGRSCADCHGEAPSNMKGVAARYPAFDSKRGVPVNLEQRINICRIEHQLAPALAFESKELLALTVHIARQSRGMPIESTDARLTPFISAGRDIFGRRQGQLNLACAHCHNDNWGQRLAGVFVPQGHPTGYPVYRLEWQTLGSLQRRLRNCLIGMRAEIYPYGAPEYVALETFLMWRARGMTMESPAVRP
jgi:sulfur-oxidizing protein SoxA